MKEDFYHLKEDPWEKNDLVKSGEFAAVKKKIASKVRAFSEQQEASGQGKKPRPGKTLPKKEQEKVRRRLRELGYM